MAQTTKAHELAPGFKISIVNFEEKAVDITEMVHSFSIYENLFEHTTTCKLILKDAVGLIDKLPIVGDEYVVLRYRTAGFKNNGSDEFELRIRSFRVYKIGKRVESAERQQNFILHCVDDHMMLNEMIDVNQSFVGQNCIQAASKLWESNFIKTNEQFRPFDKTKKLNGTGTESVSDCRNTSSYIAPGITPFETISYLKEEAQHKSNDNVSDYVFYQDLFGFHLTTITELKNQKPAISYVVQDPGVERSDASKLEQDSEIYPTLLRTIVNYDVKKTFDTINNLGIGLYGNRVAAIDLLTKRFDEKSFSYIASADQLSPMGKGKMNSDESLFKHSGSTHTRYLPTELTTSSVNVGSPESFNGSKQYEQANEYLYPVGGKSKEVGTIKNSEADEKIADIKNRDPRVANPRAKHELLNRRISGKGILDNILISFIAPGNSDLTVGQTIYVYIPQNVGDGDNVKYSVMFGTLKASGSQEKSKPKFIVTSLRQTYEQGQSSYHTVITAVKDSLADSVETIRMKGLEEKQK